MLGKLKSLILQGQTTQNELLKVIKEDAKKFNFDDIMRCSLKIQREAECIHTSYKHEYIKTETALVIRIRDVKDDNQNYMSYVDEEELKTAIDLLKEQEKMAENREETDLTILKIYSIISLYTTFIKEEPIHRVGTPFPGGFQVKKEKDRYTCPVKKNNEDNPLAVCPFCIAEQDENV